VEINNRNKILDMVVRPSSKTTNLEIMLVDLVTSRAVQTTIIHSADSKIQTREVMLSKASISSDLFENLN